MVRSHGAAAALVRTAPSAASTIKKIRERGAAETGDHARNVDFEEDDRAEERDQHREKRGGPSKQVGATPAPSMRPTVPACSGNARAIPKRTASPNAAIPTISRLSFLRRRLPAYACHEHYRFVVTLGVHLTTPTIVVLEGDQTGQELLARIAARARPIRHRYRARVRTLRSLARKPPRDAETSVVHEAAEAMKATTARAQSGDDHAGSERATSVRPIAILRKRIDGKVIVRTGRKLPRVRPGRRHSRADLGRAHGGRRRLRRQGMARGRRRRRNRLPHRNDLAQRVPLRRRVCVRPRQERWVPKFSAARSIRSAPYTKGCSKKRWMRRPNAIPTSPTNRSSSTRRTRCCSRTRAICRWSFRRSIATATASRIS